ncbi:hypothetical protein QVD17_18405 [Tagetes erecta]|uniref:Uncharacterized protein n=1 Tax=Tagetes erecta TaxID=13708 RepID=A0AAD8KHP8_TARER|nr:hypothetical protein QVD17_18405 [Tagetes erecta]
MGNYTSSCNCNCTLIISPRTKNNNNNKSTKVIFPSGDIRQYHDPVNAAEIMFECPNFFLVNSVSLYINKRFSPLSADEELDPGNVYVMFPMRRKNSMVTPADVWMAVNGVEKRMDWKICSESKECGDVKQPLLDGIAELPEPEFSYRLVVCRSRKPLLDTIAEETVMGSSLEERGFTQKRLKVPAVVFPRGAHLHSHKDCVFLTICREVR